MDNSGQIFLYVMNLFDGDNACRLKMINKYIYIFINNIAIMMYRISLFKI